MNAWRSNFTLFMRRFERAARRVGIGLAYPGELAMCLAVGHLESAASHNQPSVMPQINNLFSIEWDARNSGSESLFETEFGGRAFTCYESFEACILDWFIALKELPIYETARVRAAIAPPETDAHWEILCAEACKAKHPDDARKAIEVMALFEMYLSEIITRENMQ